MLGKILLLSACRLSVKLGSIPIGTLRKLNSFSEPPVLIWPPLPLPLLLIVPFGSYPHTKL